MNTKLGLTLFLHLVQPESPVQEMIPPTLTNEVKIQGKQGGRAFNPSTQEAEQMMSGSLKPAWHPK